MIESSRAIRTHWFTTVDHPILFGFAIIWDCCSYKGDSDCRVVMCYVSSCNMTRGKRAWEWKWSIGFLFSGDFLFATFAFCIATRDIQTANQEGRYLFYNNNDTLRAKHTRTHARTHAREDECSLMASRTTTGDDSHTADWFMDVKRLRHDTQPVSTVSLGQLLPYLPARYWNHTLDTTAVSI